MFDLIKFLLLHPLYQGIEKSLNNKQMDKHNFSKNANKLIHDILNMFYLRDVSETVKVTIPTNIDGKEGIMISQLRVKNSRNILLNIVASKLLKHGNIELFSFVKGIVKPNKISELKYYAVRNNNVELITEYCDSVNITDDTRKKITKELAKYTDYITYSFKNRLNVIELINDMFRDREYDFGYGENDKVNLNVVKYLLRNFPHEKYQHYLLMKILENGDIELLDILAEMFCNTRETVPENNRYYQEGTKYFDQLLHVCFILEKKEFIAHLMNKYNEKFWISIKTAFLYYVTNIDIFLMIIKEIDFKKITVNEFLYSYINHFLNGQEYYKYNSYSKSVGIITVLEYLIQNYYSHSYKEIIQTYFENFRQKYLHNFYVTNYLYMKLIN
jgi:hypothetical protein